MLSARAKALRLFALSIVQGSQAVPAVLVVPAGIDASPRDVDDGCRAMRVSNRVRQGQTRTPRVAADDPLRGAELFPQFLQILHKRGDIVGSDSLGTTAASLVVA
jgi:hypothetical protein